MTEYTYGELYAVGNHGDIFEVVKELEGVPGLLGKRVAIDVLPKGGKVITPPECLGNDDYNKIIVPSGNWTGAKYRKVDQFINIPFYTAIEKLQKGHAVYFKTIEGYTQLSSRTHVDYIAGKHVLDFDDLINDIEWFYKK